ncbi:hypothetical protein E2C01_011942 [Portunus trituberculatus]|uniref:Uncharacterized protein n=1 Tax=Portunus trituberculatus TaxID=210409 RepID=A0A5B7DD66_PORTR|nr:hypothetical protein [Portunus trituberculatus]
MQSPERDVMGLREPIRWASKGFRVRSGSLFTLGGSSDSKHAKRKKSGDKTTTLSEAVREQCWCGRVRCYGAAVNLTVTCCCLEVS